MFLDGDTFLDLPGMLRYVHTLPPLPLLLHILHIYCIHIHTLLTTRLLTSTFQPSLPLHPYIPLDTLVQAVAVAVVVEAVTLKTIVVLRPAPRLGSRLNDWMRRTVLLDHYLTASPTSLSEMYVYLYYYHL